MQVIKIQNSIYGRCRISRNRFPVCPAGPSHHTSVKKRARAGITPGSRFEKLAESCGCSFRKGGICGPGSEHLCLRHGRCGYRCCGASVPLCSPFSVPRRGGFPACGECRCTHRRRTPEFSGSAPPAGSLLLLYSSRLPPCKFALLGKHRLYKVSIYFLA